MSSRSKFSLIGAAFILLISVILTGCEKSEGPGGTSTIKGKVIIHDFDGGFQDPVPFIHPAQKEDVFIIYGEDGTTYDDDFKTSFDGSYEFQHLQKGKYRLFAYSKDSTGAKNGILTGVDKLPSFVNVEITSNGSTINAPDIIILDNNKQ